MVLGSPIINSEPDDDEPEEALPEIPTAQEPTPAAEPEAPPPPAVPSRPATPPALRERTASMTSNISVKSPPKGIFAAGMPGARPSGKQILDPELGEFYHGSISKAEGDGKWFN